MTRYRTLAIAILTILVMLGACGKKGLLGVPEGAAYPRQYPQP